MMTDEEMHLERAMRMEIAQLKAENARLRARAVEDARFAEQRLERTLADAKVGEVALLTQQIDRVLQQRDYWKGACDRLCSAVIEKRRAADV